MINLTSQDITVRIQLTNRWIGNYTVSLLNKIKIGDKDVDCKLQELQVIQKMLKYLKEYKALTNVIVPADNCLTETEMQKMWGYVSLKTEIHFQTAKFPYTN